MRCLPVHYQSNRFSRVKLPVFSHSPYSVCIMNIPKYNPPLGFELYTWLPVNQSVYFIMVYKVTYNQSTRSPAGGRVHTTPILCATWECLGVGCAQWGDSVLACNVNLILYSNSNVEFEMYLYCTHACIHLRLIKVFITHKPNMIWRWSLRQSTFLLES